MSEKERESRGSAQQREVLEQDESKLFQLCEDTRGERAVQFKPTPSA